MTFNFTDKVPPDLIEQVPLLISGSDSLKFAGKAYLIVNSNGKRLYEIRYEYSCSPFKEAAIVNTMLAVGYEEYFYLFDLRTKTNILRLKMEGYFGHFYINSDNFYVADSRGLYCIDIQGNSVWRNSHLGIDGVIIEEFVDNKILGSGEWDPPGGWQDFILDKRTGVSIE